MSAPTSSHHQHSELVTRELQRCPVCNGELRVTYQRLDDLFELVPNRFAVCTCQSCGLSCTNPQPIDNMHLLYPPGYLSSSSAQQQPQGIIARAEAWYRHDQSTFDFSLFTQCSGVRLNELTSYCDIGCGTGERVAFVVQKGCSTALGVDSFDFFNAPLDKSSHFVLSEIVDFKPARRFQLVSLFHVMEHLQDPAAMIQHIVDHVLEPNGYLLIQVPNYGGMERRVFGRRWSALDIPRHLWHFTANSLSRLITSPRLRVIRSVERNAMLHPVTFAASLHRDLHIQRIWVKSQQQPRFYWTLMRLAWILVTVLSIPLNIVQNVLRSASMLTIIAQAQDASRGAAAGETARMPHTTSTTE